MSDIVDDYFDNLEAQQPPKSTSPDIVDDYFNSLPKKESSYGDVLSKAATNAKLGLMSAVGGGMQAIGEAPASAIQTLSTPEPTLPQNPGISDYISKYATYPIRQTLAKGELAASALPGLIAPNAMSNLAQTGQQIQQEATAQARKNQPNVMPGTLKAKVSNIAEMGGQMLPILLAAGVAPEAIPALFAAQGAGATYAEQRNAGQTGGEAFLPAVTSGVANMGVGEIPMGILTAEGGGIGSKLIKGALGGEVTSQALNAVQQGINKGTIDPNMTFDQFAQSAQDIAGVGAALGGAGGTLSHGITKVSGEKLGKVADDLLSKKYDTSNLRSDIDNADISDFSTIAGKNTVPVEEAAPLQEKRQETPAPQETTPSLQDDINAGKITSDEIKQGKADGSIVFKDGKLDYAPEVVQQAAPTDAQSLVDAVNNGGQNVSSDMIRTALANGEIRFNNGKLEAVTQEQAPANTDATTLNAIKSGDLQNISSDSVRSLLQSGDISFNNGKLEITESGNQKLQAPTPEQVQAFSNTVKPQFPLLENKASQPDNLQAAKMLREQSLDNLLSQLKEGNTPKNTNIDDTNAIPKTQVDYTKAVNDFNTNHELVNNLKGKVEPENQSIKLSDIPNSDTENVRKNLDAIAERNPNNLDTKVVHDLVDNGYVKINDEGHPEITQDGAVLHQKLKSPHEEPISQELPVSEVSDVQDRAGTSTPENQHPYEEFFDKGAKLPEVSETEALPKKNVKESEPITKPTDSILPRILDQTKGQITEHLNTKENVDNIINDAKERLQTISEKQGKPLPTKNSDILASLRVARLADKFSNPSKGLSKLADYLSLAHSYKEGRPDVFEGKQYSATPNDKFLAQKDNLKEKLTNIIKKINPSVDIKFADKMFGEGEALKASGADSTNRQEVAGAYDRLKNLIHASLDISKWNPYDTAYHEAYHSIRKMLSAADDALLKKAFPATDHFSQEEHEAIAFARFMTEKNASGFSPAVRRIFLAMQQAFRDIGRTLKLGKFNSVHDIFNRVESGEVYKSYQEALRNGDIEGLRNSNLSPEEQQQAIKEISPELHDIVYDNKEVSATDTQGMLDAAAHTSEEVANAALTHRIMNENVPFDEAKTEAAIKQTLEFSMTPKEAEEKITRDKEFFKTIKENLKEPKKIANTLIDISMRPRDEIIRNASRNAIDPVTGKKKLSQAAMDVANLFSFDYHARTGHNFFQRMNDYQNKRINLVEKVTRNLNKNEKAQVASLLENPDQKVKITETVRNAVHTLAKLGKESAEFARKHGLEVDELEGFFPHQYLDNIIIPNRAEFVKDATEAYREKAKVDAQKAGEEYNETPEMAAEYEKAAQDWYRNRQLNDQGVTLSDRGGFDISGQTIPFPNSFKNRVFPKESYPYLKKWMNQDPTEVFINHLHSVARKAVANDMFGGDKWKQREIAMANEGVDPSDIKMIRQIVGMNIGAIKGSTGIPAVDNMIGVFRAAAALTMLPTTWKNAVTETFTVGIQNGSLADAVTGFKDSALAYAKMKQPGLLKNFRPDLDWARDLSDFMGTTTENASAYMNAARAQYEGTPAKYSNLIHKFLDVGQVQDITTANKDVALLLSLKNINKNAESIVKNDPYAKSSAYFLGKMLPPDVDIKKFSEYVMANKDKQLKPEFLPFIADDANPMAQAYRIALTDHVEKMVQTPTSATKALFATTPIGSLAYYLSGFNMAFEKNILGRNYNMLKDAVRNKNQYGEHLNLNTRDRLRVAYPMALTLGILTAVTAAANNIFGDRLFYNKEKKDESKGKKIASTLIGAGFPGRFASLASALMYKGNLDTNLIGPYAGNLTKFAKDTITYATGKSGTNGGKRAYYRDLMSTVIAPSTNVALTLAPLPTAVKFPLMQILNSPQARNAFVDKTAGPRQN